MFCNQCGHRNLPGSNFCRSCGAALDGTDDDATSTIAIVPVEGQADPATAEVSVTLDEIPEGLGMLVVKRGPNAGSKFVLEGDLTRVGRHPDSDIFLDDITVSRRHAEFAHAHDGYRVRDVGSLNGTYLNRERIDDVALASGDEVQIGKFKLVFLGADARAHEG